MGADPKNRAGKKLNTALVLLCWSVSFLFCRVSFFCGAPCLWVLICGCLPWRFRVAFSQKKGDVPRNDHVWAGTPLPSYDCGTTWQPGYAVLGVTSSLFTCGVTLEQDLEGSEHPALPPLLVVARIDVARTLRPVQQVL